MKREKIKILVVCKGNIFRSMSVEYCLKDFLKKRKIKNFEIESAGTKAKKEDIPKPILDALLSKKIDPRKHKQRKINKKMVEEADLIIAMDKSNRDYIEKKFGKRKVVLYKKLLFGKDISLKDLDEVIPNREENREATNYYLKYIVNYLHRNTPLLYKRLKKYFDSQNSTN